MAVIHILDKHTAELIAAGEVVERPASVVKELLENAIDAGATQVTVTIERGGIELIQIADDGSGIDAEYVPSAFIRHATSKIATKADLDTIHTLGFRGEALASIASVSKVEVLTRTELDEFACCYRIEGGEEIGLEAGARPVGTTISVRQLFYNTPARMKFLKKDASEASFVGETVTRLALSHPEVSVGYIKDGKLQYKTPGDGRLDSAVYALLGRAFAKDLLEVDDGTGNYHITGLITPPRSCRASRGMQFFFINGRFVKNRTMMAALENAYRGTLMQGKFPGCVLCLQMPCELVDVNVHPAKTEVRFANEKEVFEAVYRAVKAVLGQPGAGEKFVPLETPQATAPQPQAVLPLQQAPAYPAQPANPPVQSVQAQRIPATETLHSNPLPFFGETTNGTTEEGPETPVKQMSFTEQTAATPVPMQARAPFAGAANDEPDIQVDTLLPTVAQTTASLQYIGEAFKTYIITQYDDILCFIDKHAAHERILYEKLMASYGTVSSQLLLSAVTVNLSADEKRAVSENIDMLQNAGLDIDDFGGNTMLVRAVPADIEVKDIEGLVCELAAKLAKGSKDALSDKTQWVIHSIACKAAIKAGDSSNRLELLQLAQNILSGAVPPFCPHGRPVVLKFTKKELEKQFGRLG